MGAIINDEQEDQIEEQPIKNGERAAGSPEGAVGAEPSSAEVKGLYDDLGIKAPVPTGATKGRPKSDTVRAEDDKKKPAGNSVPKRKDGKETEDEDESKTSPDSAKGVNDGNKTDSKKPKDGEADDELQDESDKADKSVHDSKSRSEEDSKRGRKENADERDEDDESAEHDKGGEEEGESSDEEGAKRPGKSNPEVENRFKKLTATHQAELKARDELIEKQAKELEETQRKQRDAAVAQKDPEYTIDDFRKVRDEEGNILDLDENQAELAYRRWKDGFEGRKAEREASNNREAQIKEYQENAAQEVMKSSVAAYDTLTSLLDSYPELQEDSPDFDQEFSDKVMPIIKKAIIYQKGTEPGNEEGYKQVIIGLRIDPTDILEAMNAIRNQKRTLPLNGGNDNVEPRSNKNVPHKGRSSDPTVNAANDLMQELNIDKRF